MEINEAIRRILIRHSILLLAFFLGGTFVAVGVHLHDARSYVATTRLVLDTADPQGSIEAISIADTARAIVTSPEHVGAALRQAAVSRDPVQMARHDVSVESLGSSGVLQLSVKDPDPKAAAGIANALATDLIRTRLAFSQGEVEATMNALNVQLDQLSQQITDYDDSINADSAKLQAARSNKDRDTVRNRLDEETSQRDYLVQRRGTIQGQLDNLTATAATRPKPAIIQPAVPRFEAEPTGRLPDLALGALLGLLFGLGVAAALETFSPTLSGSESVARALEAPLLGELPSTPESLGATDLGQVAGHLRLAVESALVGVVELVSVGPPVDVAPLARRLRYPPARVPAGEARVGTGPGGMPGAPAIPQREEAPGYETFVVHPFGSDTDASDELRAMGLVALAPTNVKKGDLYPFWDLSRITRWPVLGVITYRTESRLRRWWREAPPSRKRRAS